MSTNYIAASGLLLGVLGQAPGLTLTQQGAATASTGFEFNWELDQGPDETPIKIVFKLISPWSTWLQELTPENANEVKTCASFSCHSETVEAGDALTGIYRHEDDPWSDGEPFLTPGMYTLHWLTFLDDGVFDPTGACSTCTYGSTTIDVAPVFEGTGCYGSGNPDFMSSDPFDGTDCCVPGEDGVSSCSFTAAGALEGQDVWTLGSRQSCKNAEGDNISCVNGACVEDAVCPSQITSTTTAAAPTTASMTPEDTTITSTTTSSSTTSSSTTSSSTTSSSTTSSSTTSSSTTSSSTTSTPEGRRTTEDSTTTEEDEDEDCDQKHDGRGRGTGAGRGSNKPKRADSDRPNGRPRGSSHDRRVRGKK